jgi:hypothetical protein
MLIIKKSKNDDVTTTFKNGYKIIEDPLKGNCFYKKRIAIDNEGNCRIEKCEICPELGYLIKDCSYGKKIKTFDPSLSNGIRISKSMYTTIDLKTGAKLQWGADTLAPTALYCDPHYFFSGLYDEPSPDLIFVDDGDIVYKTDKIINPFMSDALEFSDVLSKIYIEEDTLQIGYTKCIGLLISWFTQWSFEYPFDSYIIIDTKTGTFNVPEFKSLNFIEKDYIKNIYKEYLKGLSNLTRLLKYNCDKENKRLRILIYSGSYSTVIRIKDIDHKEIVIDHNLSGSDHFQSLIYNLISDGFKYNISEEAYNVVNSSNGDISEDMISSYIEDPNVKI